MSLGEKLKFVNKCYADCLENVLFCGCEIVPFRTEEIITRYKDYAFEAFGWCDREEWDLLWKICDNMAALAAFDYA